MYGYQYMSILAENVPFMITMKCTKYMQKETFAKGENILCPRIYLDGSFLHPNIAANTHKYTPERKITLLRELYKAWVSVLHSSPVWKGTMIQMAN